MVFKDLLKRVFPIVFTTNVVELYKYTKEKNDYGTARDGMGRHGTVHFPGTSEAAVIPGAYVHECRALAHAGLRAVMRLNLMVPLRRPCCMM